MPKVRVLFSTPEPKLTKTMRIRETLHRRETTSRATSLASSRVCAACTRKSRHMTIFSIDVIASLSTSALSRCSE